jgi:AcrR family transcriptional regulator
MDESSGESSGTGLPVSIEAVWGLRERPHKGPKPGLSLDRIVGAGVRLAAREGIGAVSMGRVAAELGAAPMALYRYVSAKDELLALMVDAAIGPPPVEHDDGDWRAGLARWAWSLREAYLRHRWTLRIPITGPPVTPNQVAWMEGVLAALAGTGLSEAEKASVLLLLSGFVRNEATLSVDVYAAFEAAGATSQQAMSAYGRLLRTLTDARRFPALHAVLAAGVFDQDDPPDAEFAFGLERLLDGVEALVRRRSGG